MVFFKPEQSAYELCYTVGSETGDEIKILPVYSSYPRYPRFYTRQDVVFPANYAQIVEKLDFIPRIP